MKYNEIQDIIFKGKQNIQWPDVENYLRKYEGKTIIVKETGDEIKIKKCYRGMVQV